MGDTAPACRELMARSTSLTIGPDFGRFGDTQASMEKRDQS